MSENYSSITDIKIDQHIEDAVVSTLIRLACKEKMSVALWRLPGESRKHLLIDTSQSLSSGRVDLEETGGGFLVAPYHNPDRSRELLLKSDIYYHTGQDHIATANNPDNQKIKNILIRLEQEIQQSYQAPNWYYHSNGLLNTSDVKYQEMVRNALDEIRLGHFQKVVPAAIRQVQVTDGFNWLDIFDKLCHSYPTAFISLVSTPNTGTWLGASPEAIIEVDKSKVFTTVAVAGTQACKPGISVQDVAWKQKEIEEQALVSRYIINCFKKIRLREFEEIGPKTVVAGNLLHLKTTYTVDMEGTNFPLLGSVMLDLLHPTSAVCGMPKTPAQEFLRKNEGFDRKLFSGYLGPVNMDNETHLFVNLRCMQIQPKHVILYAGAGVTEDSSPKKEWVETQLKCDTLLEVMN